MSIAYAQFKDDPDGSQGEKGGQPTPSVLPPYSDAPPPAHMVGSGPVMSQSIIRQQSVFIPKDYFGLALFVTVCCFLPLGIVALVKSSDVRTRAMYGDQLGAEQASQNARQFAYIGLGIGIASWAVMLVITIIYIAVVVVAVTNMLNPTPSPMPYLEFSP